MKTKDRRWVGRPEAGFLQKEALEGPWSRTINSGSDQKHSGSPKLKERSLNVYENKGQGFDESE
jgi:hypothetical protein